MNPLVPTIVILCVCAVVAAFASSVSRELRDQRYLVNACHQAGGTVYRNLDGNFGFCLR